MTEEIVRTESAAPWRAPTSSGGTCRVQYGRSYEGREIGKEWREEGSGGREGGKD